LATIDMTSARHHILQGIRTRTRLQSQMRRMLGLARSTLSEMLKRLEQLGFVRREIPIEDRRQRIVHITPSGIAAYEGSDRLMFKETINSHTPSVEIPGADGAWYDIFFGGVDFKYYDEATNRMLDELGVTFGPYPKWDPAD